MQLTPRHRLLILAATLVGMGINRFGLAGAPMTTVAGFSYTQYREASDGIYVRSPLFWLLAPLGDAASVELSGTVDSLSGASPIYDYDRMSAASFKEHRKAADVKVTGYGENFDLGVKLALSSENDYKSTGVGIDGRLYLNNKNTVLNLGLGYASDNFDDYPLDIHGSIHSREVLLGITQELTPVDIVQSNLSYALDNGYLDDAHKFTLNALGFIRADQRPEVRHKWAWLTRYNHHFADWNASSHLDYRYYRDSWGIAAHTVEASWYQGIGEDWTVRPSLRFHSQSQADFYVSEITSPIPFDASLSSDYRISSFGAFTPGLKVVRKITDNLSLSLSGEYYKQDNDWYLGGEGNSNTPMEASIVTLGMEFVF